MKWKWIIILGIVVLLILLVIIFREHLITLIQTGTKEGVSASAPSFGSGGGGG